MAFRICQRPELGYVECVWNEINRIEFENSRFRQFLYPLAHSWPGAEQGVMSHGPKSDEAPLRKTAIQNCRCLAHFTALAHYLASDHARWGKSETHTQGQSPHRLVQNRVRGTGTEKAPQDEEGHGSVAAHSLHTPF